jgi:hypothetical protein
MADAIREMLREEIAAAIQQLRDAAKGLVRQSVTPPTPLPRARVFYIAPGVQWPGPKHSGPHPFYCMGIPSPDGEVYPISLWDGNVTERIGGICQWQPREVLRAVRRLEAAAAWCRARAEGRRRAAQEIVRQQARAMETLEARAAVRAMAGGSS